ncbi:BMA_0021/BMA_0022 family TOMM bacteriocin [Endothiovibrio diazotrophicus]
MKTENYSVYDRFLQFRAVIIRAVAVAWKEEAFHEAFKNDPRKALEIRFDYNCPFDIEIKSNPNNAAWDKNLQGDWLVYRRDELRMVLPPKPENPEDELIALTKYNRRHFGGLI